MRITTSIRCDFSDKIDKEFAINFIKTQFLLLNRELNKVSIFIKIKGPGITNQSTVIIPDEIKKIVTEILGSVRNEFETGSLSKFMIKKLNLGYRFIPNAIQCYSIFIKIFED
jgi:ribosomal protein S9